MVGMVSTELLSEKFKNESEVGKQETHGGHLGLYCYLVSREMERRVPPVGIRRAQQFWTIKSSKWKINSLNEFSINY